MATPIVYIDRSDIHPGVVAALRDAVEAVVEFVEEREPQILSYGFHIDEQASTMWVVAVHPDSDSLELHLRVGGPEFRRIGEFITLRAMDVYGEPSNEVLALLHQKAQMLGGASVAIHPQTVGFART